MYIEMIDNKDNTSLYPVTNTHSVTGYKNYTLSQILNEIKNASYQGECIKKDIYICDIEGLTSIDISKVIPDTLEYACDLYVYLNGTMLTDKVDYYRLDERVVRLNRPTKVNDVYIFETSTYIKYLNSNEKNTNAHFDEKVLINNIFNRINEYAKTLRR